MNRKKKFSVATPTVTNFHRFHFPDSRIIIKLRNLHETIDQLSICRNGKKNRSHSIATSNYSDYENARELKIFGKICSICVNSKIIIITFDSQSKWIESFMSITKTLKIYCFHQFIWNEYRELSH